MGNHCFMRYATSVLFALFSLTTFAQPPYQDKLSASLKLFLSTDKKDQRFISKKDGEDYLAVFLELESARESATFPANIRIRTRAGNIATADISLNNIVSIAQLPWIKKIELPLLFAKTDTVMKKLVTVDKVLKGLAPLDKAYRGANIVIGIIDDGIDITHPEFLDSAGHTRIKALWNMDYAGIPPAGFNYGHLWLPDSIDANAARWRSGNFNRYAFEKLFGYGGHGTSVTGLAAGNNGVASKADIVSVALTAFADTLLRSDRVIDAIAFIYSKAHDLNKKCVINISLGVQDGAPHDGRSIIEKAIDNFCAERPDLLVAVSAGNNGNSWKHWAAMPVNKDSSFGLFRCAYRASMYFTFPRGYADSLRFSIGESKLGNINSPNIHRDSVYYQTPFVLLADIIQQPGGLVYNSFLRNGSPSSTITFTAGHANDDYDELIVTTDEHTSSPTGPIIFDDHLYRFIFKGTGVVHGWYPFLNLHPLYFFGNNPYPNDPTYISTDNAYSTNVPSHAFSVISSGAYNARSCFVSTLHNEVVNSYQKCQLTYFTSRGPTLDGRIKPDLIAPGENVIAPRNTIDDYLGHQFIVDKEHVAFSGTSASSPITAGIAALLWEKNPGFTRDSIIKRLKGTTFADSYTATTGSLPNNISGWGKIDAFKALSGESTDMSAICAEHISCKIDNPNPPVTPPVTTNTQGAFIKVFPNPAAYYLNITYRSTGPLQVLIYNTAGQLVEKHTFPAAPFVSSSSFGLLKLANGLYFIRAGSADGNFSVPLLILR